MEKKFLNVRYFTNMPAELNAFVGLAYFYGDSVLGVTPNERIDAHTSWTGLTVRPGFVQAPSEGGGILPAYREDMLFFNGAPNQWISIPGLKSEDKFVLFSISGHGALGRLERAVLTTLSELQEAFHEWDAWRSGNIDANPSKNGVGYFARRISLSRARTGSRYLLKEVVAAANQIEVNGNDWVAKKEGRFWMGTSSEEGSMPQHWY